MANSEQNMPMIGKASECDVEVDMMPEEPPIVMYCMKQISFLTREVDRLEDELASERAAHCKEIKRVWQKVRQSSGLSDKQEMCNAFAEDATHETNEKECNEKENANTNSVTFDTKSTNESEEEKAIAASQNTTENSEQKLCMCKTESCKTNCSHCHKHCNAEHQLEEQAQVTEQNTVANNFTQEKELHTTITTESAIKEIDGGDSGGSRSNSSRDDNSSLLTHDLTKSESDVYSDSVAEEKDEESKEERNTHSQTANRLEQKEEHDKIRTGEEYENENENTEINSNQLDAKHAGNNSTTYCEKEVDVYEGCELVDIAVQSDHCNAISVCIQTDEEYFSYVNDFSGNNSDNFSNTDEHTFTETDRLRAKLSEMCAAHRKAVETIKQLTNRLQDEYHERQTLILDNAQITSELELLRKQMVQEINTQASMQSTIDEMQAAHEQACNTVQVLETDKQELHRRLNLHENNLQQLSDERVHFHNQLECLGRDNEQMNVALQSAHARVSRLNEELHAKDAELHEIAEMYHSCVRESEMIASSNAQLLMQIDALKSQMAYQEQQLICHEEEQAMMQSKEMQLTSDVQLLSYDTEQLQRRLADTEERVVELQYTCQQLTQTNDAKECQLRTFNNSCTQLHKQLVLCEEELQCYRNDRAEFEQRVQEWQERANVAESKLSLLENKHAQLLTQHVLLTSSNTEPLQETMEQCKQEIKELKAELESKQNEAERRQEECDELRAQILSVQQELTDAHESKTRLQKIVMEQANTLAELSREEDYDNRTQIE